MADEGERAAANAHHTRVCGRSGTTCEGRATAWRHCSTRCWQAIAAAVDAVWEQMRDWEAPTSG